MLHSLKKRPATALDQSSKNYFKLYAFQIYIYTYLKEITSQKVHLTRAKQTNLDKSLLKILFFQMNFFGRKCWAVYYVISQTQLFEWNKAFSKAHGVIENRCQSESTAVNDDNEKKNKESALENRPVDNREVAEDLNICYG